jgi:hypothetical protein
MRRVAGAGVVRTARSALRCCARHLNWLPPRTVGVCRGLATDGAVVRCRLLADGAVALGSGLGARVRVEVALDLVLDSSAGRGVVDVLADQLPVLRSPGRASTLTCSGVSVHTTPCASAVIGGGRESSSEFDSSSSSEPEVPSLDLPLFEPPAYVGRGRLVPRGGSSFAAGSPSSPSSIW